MGEECLFVCFQFEDIQSFAFSSVVFLRTVDQTPICFDDYLLQKPISKLQNVAKHRIACDFANLGTVFLNDLASLPICSLGMVMPRVFAFHPFQERD